MKIYIAILSAAVLLTLPLASQTSGPAATYSVSPVVPPLIHFASTATDESGTPLAGITEITFSLYASQKGGEAIWSEIQRVELDPTGAYSVQLGATQKTGVPASLFTNGKARWLSVQIEGHAEQPRILLLSVPYALKAADAETIGGLPPSAFVLANPNVTGTTSAATTESPTVAPPVSGTGTTNFLPIWLDSAGTLGNSTLFQSGTGATAKIGINTNTPTTTFDVKGGATIRGILSLPATGVSTATAGKASQPVSMAASAFDSGTSTAVNETFRWQAEPVGNNTTATSGSLNLLFAQGSAAPIETGFQIASNGLLTFAPGQTFPGANGTITGVTAGTGLTGGGTSGNVTLNVDTTTLPKLSGGNAFVGDQTVTGNIIANGRAVAGTFTTLGAGTGVLGTATGGTGVEGSDLGSGRGVNGVSISGIGGFFATSSSSSPALFVWNSVDGPVLQAFSSASASKVLDVGPTSLSFAAATAGTHDPIAQFGSTGTSDQNAIKTFNGTGNTEVFIAGKTNGFVPGTAVGDGGLRVNKAQKIFFGDSSLARMSIDGSGNVKVTGNLSKGGGSFKIDHPLDPLNKYLYHSFVESPDMMNVYNGNVVTDKRGQAVVTLPDYFEALNRDFRYQLTVIGQFAQAIVARKIAHNRFVIKTNRPSVEVSWQITGIRQDPYANAHRIPVEEEKLGAERGSYLHPDAYSGKDNESRAVAEVVRRQ